MLRHSRHAASLGKQLQLQTQQHTRVLLVSNKQLVSQTPHTCGRWSDQLGTPPVHGLSINQTVATHPEILCGTQISFKPSRRLLSHCPPMQSWCHLITVL